ncbi:MAG: tRNA (N6-isopentenyl adenosine(37)-C2)-methylthiotransferase MiaB, partial [Firmicutes bacterium]|nr:tRNA (N6-isopentenyl adenosine(37)-C2)-methylthiotransferase MiaB [Bacillota bacterium]
MSKNADFSTKTYFINTYGCQMNVHESEKMSGIMDKKGMKRADKLENADVVIYNTCCVRNTAETKVYGHLGRGKKFKEKAKENGRDFFIVMCGCIPQKPDAAADLIKKYPFIDL